MFERFCHRVMRVAEFICGYMFAALIAVVALQVLDRNILELSWYWTSDVAQLLFVWLVFVGAAIGLRRGAHYFVDVLPFRDGPINAAMVWFGIIVSTIVIYILITNGWTLTEVRARGTIQSINLSRFWLYVPIPVSGVLMALFLAEIALRQFRSTEAEAEPK